MARRPGDRPTRGRLDTGLVQPTRLSSAQFPDYCDTKLCQCQSSSVVWDPGDDSSPRDGSSCGDGSSFGDSGVGAWPAVAALPAPNDTSSGTKSGGGSGIRR